MVAIEVCILRASSIRFLCITRGTMRRWSFARRDSRRKMG
jgi:hypothetical protein